MLAPWSSSSRTTSTWPRREAHCSGALPNCGDRRPQRGAHSPHIDPPHTRSRCPRRPPSVPPHPATLHPPRPGPGCPVQSRHWCGETRGLTHFRGGIHAGAMLEQHPHDVHVAVSRGRHQRRHAKLRKHASPALHASLHVDHQETIGDAPADQDPLPCPGSCTLLRSASIGTCSCFWLHSCRFQASQQPVS